MENIETLLAAAAAAQTQGFDDDDAVVSTAPERGSENPGSSPVVGTTPKSEFPASEMVVCAGEKRKRGRPPKGQVSVKPPPPKRIKPDIKPDEAEDVCFICFDGGSLILCDRKGCPKAYHPACIKRSEAFFKSKAKWNCGWHICGVCQKSSHYKCYTCTYSLCKGCTKDADYLLVRENKGFCPICMKTIMLIENKDQANEVHVDFDDQTSWEYLFKVYWVILKESLSLTLDELTQAKNRWKGLTTIGYKPLLSNVIPTAVSVKAPTEHLEVKHVEANLPLPSNSNANYVETKKNENEASTHVVMQETSVDKDTDKPGIEKHDKPGIEKHEDHLSSISHTHQRCLCKHMKEKELEKMGISCSDSTEWATKALLEFVAHMKEGDTSAMSQFDVQALLVDYVNRNNLWIAHRKNQIKCDERLKKLFGKAGISRVQMLKHLKSHFLVKEASQKESFIPGGFVSSVESNIEVDESDKSGGDGKKDESGNPSHSGFPQNGRKPVSPNKEGNEERSIHIQNGIEEEKTDDGVLNNSDKLTNQVNISVSSSDGGNDKKDMQGSGRETLTATTASVENSSSSNQVNITDSASDGGNDKKDTQSSGKETLTATTSVGNSPSSNNLEVEKLWHYRDSDGKIRGPFSIMQLREWSTTGLYQPDMRIWTHHEHYDSLPLTEAVHGKLHGACDLSNSGEEGEARGATWGLSEATNVSGGDCKQIEEPINTPVLAENSTKVARTDESGSWPQCWDFLKDDNFNNSSANDVRASDLLPSSNPEKIHKSDEFHHHGESNSIGLAQNPMTSGCEVQDKSHNEDKAGLSSEENPRSLDIDLMCSNYMGLSNNYMENISFSDPSIPTRPNTVSSDVVPVQNSGILELLSPAPRSNDEDQAKNPGLMNLPEMQIPEIAEEWCKFSPALASVFSLRPPEITCEDILATSHPVSNVPSFLSNINEPIEFDALGEDSVSDLLAEVDAMESLRPLHSPTSYIKFARELLEDTKDDCFSSIEEFGTARKSGMNAQSSSSEGETNHAGPVAGPDGVDPGWGRVQGNVNFVTVQGNVNLVIGGPGGGMTGLGWASPNLNLGGMNGGGSLPWDGQQQKYSGEQWGRAPPWGRQGQYMRPVSKGQRVCKFYGSGHCKKGAFCDYLHPHM